MHGIHLHHRERVVNEGGELLDYIAATNLWYIKSSGFKRGALAHTNNSAAVSGRQVHACLWPVGICAHLETFAKFTNETDEDVRSHAWWMRSSSPTSWSTIWGWNSTGGTWKSNGVNRRCGMPWCSLQATLRYNRSKVFVRIHAMPVLCQMMRKLLVAACV